MNFLKISFLVFILPISLFAQAAVDIVFSATDSAYYSMDLSIGLDLTATNCIDSLLGEGDPQIFPPPGVFEIRFDLNPYGCGYGVSTYKDYRPPGNPPAFPFTGTIEHTLWFQVTSPGVSAINLTYNLPYGTTMIITDQIGGSIFYIGPFTGQGIATIPGTYTQWFSKALLIMEYNNIVPIELTSFTASVLQNEKAVKLNWTTATETNNSGFEIHRLTQNDEWDNVGFVPGHGTTTETHHYSFTDNDVKPGKYQYKLKQIDYAGTFEYSQIVEVEIPVVNKFSLSQNYPNPFNPSTKIKYTIPEAAFVTLKLFGVLGNQIATLVNEEQPAGVHEVEFNALKNSWFPASGVYIYQLRAGSFVETKKMILLK